MKNHPIIWFGLVVIAAVAGVSYLISSQEPRPRDEKFIDDIHKSLDASVGRPNRPTDRIDAAGVTPKAEAPKQEDPSQAERLALAANLITAIDEGDPHEVEKLLNAGASANTVHASPFDGAEEKPVIVEAAIKGKLKIVQLLVQHGANMNTQTSRDKQTALHIAARAGAGAEGIERTVDHDAIVEYLCQHGANANIPDKNRRMPLHEAIYSAWSRGDTDCRAVKALMRAGADTKVKDGITDHDALEGLEGLGRYTPDTPQVLAVKKAITDAINKGSQQ